MNKASVLSEIAASRERFEGLLKQITPGRMTVPGAWGPWSLKDLLAHIEFWERSVANLFDRLQAGEIPGGSFTEEVVNNLNDQAILANQARTLRDVTAGEREAYRALVRMTETAADADLFDANRFAWMRGTAFAEWIIGNSSGHWEEHWATFEAGLSSPQAVAIVERAREFIASHGRDIDQARMDFHFGGAPLERLMDVLARYQNPDGGFFGLEVDIEAPQSNPFAVELALTIMLAARVPAGHPVLQKTTAFLESKQHEDGTWRFVPEIYQHSLAPWFQGWQWPNLNPSCPIASLLKQLGAGSDLLHARVQGLFDRLARYQDLTGPEFYNVKPYADYLQVEWNVPGEEFYRLGVAWWLLGRRASPESLDASHWVQLAPDPALAVAGQLPREAIDAELDRLAVSQDTDGGWPTPYSPRWRPWITVQNLLALRAYGRI